MADDDTLSQSEIDALLGNAADEDEAASQTGSGGKRIRPFDPSESQRMVRGRLHALDVINERFARHFRVSLFNLIRRSAEVSVASVRTETYQDFARNLPTPANINLFSMKPLRGTALAIFPPDWVFLVVDSLFGGDGLSHPHRRPRVHPHRTTHHRPPAPAGAGQLYPQLAGHLSTGHGIPARRNANALRQYHQFAQ
jgi:flagellar motor switch protein FliM